MATKPTLRRAVPNSKIKAADYNFNFDQINNYIEGGIADNAIGNYEADREFKKGQWVLAEVDGEYGLYESLYDGNKGNSLTDGEYWKRVNLGGGLNLFDTVLKDHVLTYEESKGLALQGTYVYKSALAGSRYGYPDFYNKVIEEYNEATGTETINGVDVKVHSNGHKFYDIANKEGIDGFYDSMGYAWFYGVDTENERIFLPRDKYFAIKGSVDTISVYGNGIGLGFTDGSKNYAFGCYAGGTRNVDMFYEDGYGKKVATGFPNISTSSISKVVGITTNPTKSGLIADSSNVVQPNENKYLYICVGNTTNYAGVTDVVDQGMEILEQVNQGLELRVNLDATNLSAEGKSLISSYPMPSSKKVDLTLGASGSEIVAPASGYLVFSKRATAAGQSITLMNKSGEVIINATSHSSNLMRIFMPAKKGDRIYYDYSATTGDTEKFHFVYAEGEV